jgi:hypothetical protein
MYTFDNDPSAEERIARDQALIARAVTEVVPERHLAAVVLIGGYGRGQGGYVLDEEGNAAPFNDYDYFVIFRGIGIRRARQYISRLPVHSLESATGVEVDFFPLLETELHGLEFSLMYAEMQAAHHVIAGNESVLECMKPMPIDQVPMTEMVRLMSNRGHLLLMNYAGMDSERFSTYINKAMLAAGDAWLASIGKYDVDYRIKLERMDSLCEDMELARLFRRSVEARFRPDLCPALGTADLYSATQVWLRTLQSIETERLGRFDWNRYCTPAMPKQPRGNWLKNVLLNLKDRRLSLTGGWLMRHPRERVISTLPVMLSDAMAGKASEQWRVDAARVIDLWYSYS